MRRKGEVTRRRIDWDWPHQVELRTPDGAGLGRLYDDMVRVARTVDPDHRLRTVSRRPHFYTRFCFRTPDAADRFLEAVRRFVEAEHVTAAQTTLQNAQDRHQRTA